MVTSHDIHVDEDYAKWIAELKHRYRSAQVKAAVRVNGEKLLFNWQPRLGVSSITLQQVVGELQTSVNQSTTKLHQLGGELAIVKLHQAGAEMSDKKLYHFGRELYETRLYQTGKEFPLPFVPVPLSCHLRQYPHKGCSAHTRAASGTYAPVAKRDERNQAFDAERNRLT